MNDEPKKTPKVEVVIAVISSAITALLLFLFGAFNKIVTEADQRVVTENLIKSKVFLDLMKDKLKGETSLKGDVGETGPKGDQGPQGKDNDGVVGSVVAFAGSLDSIPTGWHICDGSELKRNEYKALFDVLGVQYGGDGKESFKLPNYQGYFLRGLDPSGTVDYDRKASDQVVGNIQLDSIGPHKHEVRLTGNNPGHKYKDWQVTKWGNPNNENDPKAGGGQGYKTAEEKEKVTTPTAKISLSGTSELNTGHGSETRPKNIAVNWIIRIR